MRQAALDFPLLFTIKHTNGSKNKENSLMATKTASVAQEILAYCTSCKMDLNATVVAMKGDRVAKVECMTCKKTHAFKAPKGQKEPKKKSSKKKDAGPTISIEAEWEKLMTTHKDAPT